MNLSSSRLLVVATTASVPLAVVGCGTTDGPPCFDGTYDVEFLERLPESDCPEPWAAGWRFRVEPISATDAPEACRSVSLRLVGDAPPRDIGPAVATVVFPYPVLSGGAVDQILANDPTTCDARTDLAAMIPVGYADIAQAAEEDAVIWGVYINDISDACEVSLPSMGRCSEFYRSRMVKVGDWTPESR